MQTIESENLRLARALSSAKSTVSVKAFDLPQGNLAVYYPEANRLTARSTDPRSHTPNFKSVAVRVVARLAKQSPASK